MVNVIHKYICLDTQDYLTVIAVIKFINYNQAENLSVVNTKVVKTQ